MKSFVAICLTVLLVLSVSAQGFNIPAGFGPGSASFQQRMAKFAAPGGLLEQWSAPGGLFDQYTGPDSPYARLASRNWRQYLNSGSGTGAPAY
ncbi:hypothetical protein SNE40_019234 [Patella caerulea]|uniref:Uncharacterized protein n=1 Tax=Patella caerulea TaxID=87958 RepID=A0AAN8J686_PATCE